MNLRSATLRTRATGVAASADASKEGSAASQHLQQRSKWEYPDAAQVDQRDPSTFGFTEIGVVVGAHGTRGELKVNSDSDFGTERLCKRASHGCGAQRRAPREMRLVKGRKGRVPTPSW